MSDSEPELPPAASIERALRQVVIELYKAGKEDDLTVKRVRARAEESLGLSAGFLKSDETWKQKSHDVIHKAVEKYCVDEPPQAPSKSSPKKVASKPKAAAKKDRPKSESTRGGKRKAAAQLKKPQKRRKTVSSDEDEESELELSEPPARDATPSDAESEPPKKKPAPRSKKVVAEDSDDEDEGRREQPSEDPIKDNGPTPATETKGEASESELSSLIDESPKKKKRQKKSPPAKKQKETKSKAAKPRAKTKVNDDPDQAEIKRLQGWLVKCGIRKVWSKELAKCDTPNDKIKHLKALLKDAGMEGKYSNEKAAAIKEQREFAKDLAAIQEGELAWGKTAAEDTGGRPRRRLARGPPKPAPVIKDDSEEDEDAKEDAEPSEENDDDDEVKPESESDGDENGDSADSDASE